MISKGEKLKLNINKEKEKEKEDLLQELRQPASCDLAYLL